MAGITSHLLYDGHGSTRQLANSNGAVTANYAYDVYGKMLGGNPGVTDGKTSATDLLYAGEQFDPGLQMEYLRARYYDQDNGRFNRLDPFEGNSEDPQSLHKYAYAHCDPVNGIDPNGMSLVSLMVTIAAIAVVANISLTIYSGIRSNQSTSMIALNVAMNLATFITIAGAILLTGPVAIAAIVTLALSSAVGTINLVSEWKNMDNIDRAITVGIILTYMVFAGAVRYSTIYANSSTQSSPLDWSIVKQKGKNKGETRQVHVRQHNINDISKDTHGVFYEDAVTVINKAWNNKGNIKPTQQGNIDIYRIPYKNAGWEGGNNGSGQVLNYVHILVMHGTNEIITGFPGR